MSDRAGWWSTFPGPLPELDSWPELERPPSSRPFRILHCAEKGALINFVVGHIATLVVGTMHFVRLQSRCHAGDVQ